MATKTLTAYLFVRRKILDMVVPPSTQIRPAHIQERLKMSRPPVLDALLWLQAEGYLTNDHNQAFYVTDWTADEIRQTYGVRAMHAEYAADGWSQVSTDKCWQTLHDAVTTGRAALTGNRIDTEALTVSIRTFDTYLVQSGRDLLAKQDQMVTPPAQFRRTARLLGAADFRAALESRERLLHAIIRHDGSWARGLARCTMYDLMHRHLAMLEAGVNRYTDNWIDVEEVEPFDPEIMFDEGGPDIENTTLATLRPKF